MNRVRRRANCAVVLMGVVALLFSPVALGSQPDPPGQAVEEPPVHEAYLFAHMTHSDYGRLYYSVSRDGLHWEALNEGKRVFDDYRGHPDICKGHDGRYYLVGNRNDSAPDINFWVSGYTFFKDWDKYTLPPKVRHGCMITITASQYDALGRGFGKDDKTP